MRLLDATSFNLKSGEQSVFKQDGYAILSHRWIGDEITLDQLKNHIAKLRITKRPLSTPQVDKISGACETARKQGIKWMWIDTCCIDKTSAVEQTESINSTYTWYRGAKVCITHLYDVKKDSTLDGTHADIFTRVNGDGPSEWFFRGWTLQELLVPREQQFYDMDWNLLGTKQDLVDMLESVTRIEAQYLTNKRHFGEACIATKMSWMAGRKTSRPEDIAYSMLGIFNVNMVPQYGEGMRAFMRLQNLLLSTSVNESVFAWRMPEINVGARYNFSLNGWAPDEWGLLAPSPEWFRDSGHIRTGNQSFPLRKGRFSLLPEGLQAPVPENPLVTIRGAVIFGLVSSVTLLLGAIPYARYLERRAQEKRKADLSFPLNCWEDDTDGKMAPVSIYLRPGPSGKEFKRVHCMEFAYGDVPRKKDRKTKAGFALQPQSGYVD